MEASAPPCHIPHSLADITKAKTLLGYEPKVAVREGIRRAYDWYRKSVEF